MLPELIEQPFEPFTDELYVYEPKIDGHRLILSREGKETRLWTRYKEECTRQYPELHSVPIEGDMVLDGEACCMNPDTRLADLGLVMERLQLMKKRRIASFAAQRPVNYVIWDILFYKGRDLRDLPLMKRRSILESVLMPDDRFILVPQTEDSADALLRSDENLVMKGIVAKKKDSPYVSRRSHDWLSMVKERN